MPIGERIREAANAEQAERATRKGAHSNVLSTHSNVLSRVSLRIFKVFTAGVEAVPERLRRAISTASGCCLLGVSLAIPFLYAAAGSGKSRLAAGPLD